MQGTCPKSDREPESLDQKGKEVEGNLQGLPCMANVFIANMQARRRMPSGAALTDTPSDNGAGSDGRE